MTTALGFSCDIPEMRQIKNKTNKTCTNNTSEHIDDGMTATV